MQIRLDPMKIKIPLAHFLYVYRGFKGQHWLSYQFLNLSSIVKVLILLNYFNFSSCNQAFYLYSKFL